MRRRIFHSDWLLLALAVALITPLYWPSLRFDLFQDDYYLLRPWPPEHVASVLTGPWFDPQTPDFYRPFAIYLYKAMFWAFGLNTRALHILPLATMSVLAWLTGVFVRRETDSRWLGALATSLYALHPSTTAAIGPWVSNQYQGIVSGMVMVALLWWQSCRDRGWRAWVPLFIPAVIGGFTKETGLMIPLIIPLVHEARARWIGDIPRISRAILMGALGTFAVLNIWRVAWLGTLVPDGRVRFDILVRDFLRGPYTVLLEPLNFANVASKWTFALTGVLLAGSAAIAVIRRTPRTAAILGLTGAVILLTSSAPTSLVFSRDRLTPHGLAAVLLLTGGVAALWDAIGRRATRLIPAVVLAVVATTATVNLARTAMWRFDPCKSSALKYPDVLLEEVRRPPPEMLDWLGRLPSPCDARTFVPFFRATDHITWGVAERTLAPERRRYTWMTRRVVALVDQRATSVTIDLRHLSASPTRPVTVRVQANGGPPRDIQLVSSDWATISLPLRPNWHTWLRQMHRLDMVASANAVPGLDMRLPDLHY